MAEGISFRGMDDTRTTELTEIFREKEEGLRHQVLGIDKEVRELGMKLDKMDVKFEELKELIMSFRNQGSTVVKLETSATSEDTGLKSNCMEEVN